MTLFLFISFARTNNISTVFVFILKLHSFFQVSFNLFNISLTIGPIGTSISESVFPSNGNWGTYHSNISSINLKFPLYNNNCFIFSLILLSLLLESTNKHL